MIDISIGRNKVLSIDPERIIAVGDSHLSDGCTIYVDGMKDINLPVSRLDILKQLKQYYERKYNSKRDNSSSGILDDNTNSFFRCSCKANQYRDI